MNNEICRKIYENLSNATPNPDTELVYHSNFELLIAVVLSAQSTDVRVNKVTKNLFVIANTAKDILSLGQERLENEIKTIGLFRAKAKNIIGLCKQLIDLHAGQVPSSREQLENLPGVGRKTANVILNTAFREPVIAVDTHIFRVANRTGLAVANNVRDVEEGLQKITPNEYLLKAHHLLLLHGRYICKARLAECWRCPIRSLCEYSEKLNNNPKIKTE